MPRKLDSSQLLNLLKNSIQNFYLTKIIDQQKKQVEAFYYYDLLTGLISFQTFYQLLNYSIHDAIRFKHSLGLIYIDIDNFIVVNDGLGHLAGDEILIEISKRLKAILPQEAIISRSSEDEFLILMSGLDIENELMKMANKIHKELHRPYFLVVDKILLTVSQGVAFMRDTALSADQLLQQAEVTLAKAKKSGGNCIVI